MRAARRCRLTSKASVERERCYSLVSVHRYFLGRGAVLYRLLSAAVTNASVRPTYDKLEAAELAAVRIAPSATPTRAGSSRRFPKSQSHDEHRKYVRHRCPQRGQPSDCRKPE